MMVFTTKDLEKQSGYSGSVLLENIGDVAVIRMKCGENRLNWTLCERLNNALDDIESNPNIKAVVLTGDGKFFSNGMDVNWFGHIMHNKPAEDLLKAVKASGVISTRFLTFPVPVVAALNGHTFAGGAMLALACDARVMNSQKGWFCLNEIHLKMHFSETSVEILKAKLPRNHIHDAGVLGKRYTAKEALNCGIVCRVCDGSDLEQTAVAMAKEMIRQGAYDRVALRKMKESVYRDVLEAGQRVTPENMTESGFLAKL